MSPKNINWILFCATAILYNNCVNGLYTESISSVKKVNQLLTKNVRVAITRMGPLFEGVTPEMLVTLKSDTSIGCLAVQVAANLLLTNSDCIEQYMEDSEDSDNDFQAHNMIDKSIHADVLEVHHLTLQHHIGSKNLALVELHCKKLQLNSASWNITSPGHGKSTADAIGGTVKKLCDQCVLRGHDITSVDDMKKLIDRLDGTIKIFVITSTDIQMIDKLIQPKLKVVPQASKIFQLLWTHKRPNSLHLNYLSCLQCLDKPPCKHFSLKPNIFNFDNLKNSENCNKNKYQDTHFC